MRPKRQQQDRAFVEKEKKKSATEALHMKWLAKIYNSKQWYLNVQNKLVAWKSLTIAANYKYFSTSQSLRITAKTNCNSDGSNSLVCTHILKILLLSKWSSHSIFSFESVYFVFVFKEIQLKNKGNSESFPIVRQTLNSPSMTNMTWGYMNVFDWLANQLTSKQDRAFGMIGQ